MGSGMRFLALLTLFGAASAGSRDEVALVQARVKAGSLESAAVDVEGLARGITRIAMNHSRSSVFKDPKKRDFVTRMMSRLGVLVASAGKAGEEEAAVQSFDRDVGKVCFNALAPELSGYGLGLANLFARLNNCPDDDAGCQARPILELVGTSMDLFVRLANLEQDCGKPLLEELQDCASNKDGYLSPPRDKNFKSFATEVIAWAALATAGVLQAEFACRQDASNPGATAVDIPFFGEKPIEPLVFIALGAVKWAFSARGLRDLYKYPGTPKAGKLEFCEGASKLGAKSLDLLRSIFEAVAQEKHEGDPAGGVGELCAAGIFQASTSVPEITERFCAYKSCAEGTFKKADFKMWKAQGRPSAAERELRPQASESE